MNPVVVYLLCISAIHSRQFFLNPLVLYHPGQENLMADNTYHLFNLPDTHFLSHMSSTYPQPQN